MQKRTACDVKVKTDWVLESSYEQLMLKISNMLCVKGLHNQVLYKTHITFTHCLHVIQRLTLLSADTNTVVEDEVDVRQLAHHAGSFKERLQDKEKIYSFILSGRKTLWFTFKNT